MKKQEFKLCFLTLAWALLSSQGPCFPYHGRSSKLDELLAHDSGIFLIIYFLHYVPIFFSRV